jgi:hypothetical protein
MGTEMGREMELDSDEREREQDVVVTNLVQISPIIKPRGRNGGIWGEGTTGGSKERKAGRIRGADE